MEPLPLRPIRQVLHITQAEMAVLLDVSRLTYIAWEKDIDKMPLGKYRQAWQHLSRLHDLKVATPPTNTKEDK